MVSVIVGYNGEPLYVTTRYNHDYDWENNQSLRTAEQVSRLIGVDFYDVFRPNEIGIRKKEMEKKLEEKVSNNPRFVDLGLSVKWCNYNFGASSPEYYGEYFAWGETEEKEEYSEDTYDNDEPFDDVGLVYGIGRIPTIDEFDELSELDRFWGQNRNAIFLPTAGHRDNTEVVYDGSSGTYWSSTCQDRNSAYGFSFFNNDVSALYTYYRFMDFSVRLVQE